jgi:hypothetical protein
VNKDVLLKKQKDLTEKELSLQLEFEAKETERNAKNQGNLEKIGVAFWSTIDVNEKLAEVEE